MDFNRLTKGQPRGPQKVEIEITWKSIFRVLAGVLLAYVAVVLWPIFKLLIVAALLAVALSPLSAWFCTRGCPRWLGLAITSGVLMVVVLGCFAVVGPVVYRQTLVLGENLPKLREQVIAQVPSTGVLHNALEKGLNPETVSDSRRLLEQAMGLAKSTVGGLVEFVMVLALAVYLMADGPKIISWIILFFPARRRESIGCGLREISKLVFAYVAGQFLVSTLCASYVLALLSVLGVPMALLLGIVAGICDIIPLLGFAVAVALMSAVGMTVSPTTAILVFVFYAVYHLFENVVILPRVYGKRLKLSPVAVPLAIAAGALLAGVIGAIAALPAVAAYPIVARLWLTPAEEPEPAKEHADTGI